MDVHVKDAYEYAFAYFLCIFVLVLLLLVANLPPSERLVICLRLD